MKLPEDPYILELLPEFVDQWILDINETVDQILSSKNSDELYRFGHTIKGSCFQFGLDEIATLGIEMMGYAKSNDFEKATDLAPKILKSFENVKVFIQNQNL